MTFSLRMGLAALVVAVVAAVVIAGFVMAGSPQEARLRRLDDRRVSDLRDVQIATNLHWTRTRSMPDSIDAALKAASRSQPRVDPGTGAAYEYRTLDGTSYELCAVFDRASQDPQAIAGDPFWSHAAGRQCFTLTLKELGK